LIIASANISCNKEQGVLQNPSDLVAKQDYDSRVQQTQIEEGDPEVDTSFLQFSTKHLNAENQSEVARFFSDIEKTGGRVSAVLPNSWVQVIYPSVNAANTFFSKNLSKQTFVIKKMPMTSSINNTTNSHNLPQASIIKSRDYRPWVDVVKNKVLPNKRNKLNSALNSYKSGTSHLLTSSATSSSSTPLSFVDLSTLDQFPPIGNQGNVGSCTAWSTGYYLNSFASATRYNASLKNKTKSPYMCNPSYIYPYINLGSDAGGWPVDSFNIQKWTGCAPTSGRPLTAMLLDPNDVYSYYNKDYFPNIVKTKQPGLRNRIKDYMQIAHGYDGLDNSEMENVKTALQNGQLVSVTVQSHINFSEFRTQKLVQDSSDQNNYYIEINCSEPKTRFYYPNKTFVQLDYCENMKASDGHIYGKSHQITIVGYDDERTYKVNGQMQKGAFKLANQWSTSWGENGFIWVAYSLFQQKPNDPNLIGNFLVDYPLYTIPNESSDAVYNPQVYINVQAINFVEFLPISYLVKVNDLDAYNVNLKVSKFGNLGREFPFAHDITEFVKTDNTNTVIVMPVLPVIPGSNPIGFSGTRIVKVELFIKDEASNQFVLISSKKTPYYDTVGANMPINFEFEL
jgi:C1A family cysteine protease